MKNISAAQKPYLAETYTLVSTVGYLGGVNRSVFENEHEPLRLDIFLELEQNKAARRIRHLSIVRTALEQNFSAVNLAIWYDLKNLSSLPQYIPVDSLIALEQDGISLEQANCRTDRYIMNINGYIVKYINDCKELFPIWLNWTYIRDLFVMPDGTSEKGLKKAANKYYSSEKYYPYQVYLNWDARPDHGNVLYNDKKFVSLLYQQHNDQFQDQSKVSDAGDTTKLDIYKFLAKSGRTAIIVDCENADPYKVHAMLNSIGQERLLEKVGKIMLYNDIHTSTAWKALAQFTKIPIEHYMAKRVKADKSLVDIQLTTGACREHYENGTDSFILISSDSDYWGLISTMPQIRFLVMIEEKKCSHTVKAAMESNGIVYCRMDDFCTGNSGKLVVNALLSELRSKLSDALNINLQELLSQAYQTIHVNLSEDEKQQIYSRYIKPTKIVFAANGEAVVQLGQ